MTGSAARPFLLPKGGVHNETRRARDARVEPH